MSVRAQSITSAFVEGAVPIEQSTLNGAPQCPSCWAHTMESEDGKPNLFRCPGGCPERVVLISGSLLPNGDTVCSVVYVGRLGDRFYTCGT